MKRSPLLLIWITVFIDLLGFGIVIPILPFLAKQHDASPFELGVLLASYSVMQFIFAPILGSLSDRVGRKTILAVSLIGTSLASFTLGYAAGLPGALWLLFIARMIDGITGANISVAQAYIADITTPEKRARAMGLVGMAFGLGFILGPAIGGLLSSIDIALPFYAVGALALLNAIMMLIQLPEPERHLSVTVDARSRFSRLSAALRDPRTGLLLVVFLLVTTAFAAMETTLPYLLNERFNFNASQASYMFVFVGVAMAIVQGGLVGRLAERVGERPLIVCGTGFLIAGFVLIALPSSPSYPALFGGLALLAIGIGLHNPSVQGLVSRLAPASMQGTTLGLTQSMSSLGRIGGHLLGGWLYGLSWSTPYFAGAAIVAAATLLAIYYNATVAPPVPAEAK